MEDKIKIKCPYCGAVLSVKNLPGIESKNVTCPVCKQKSLISACQKITVMDSERTQYPGAKDSEKSTEYADPLKDQNFTLGKLKVQPSGPSYQLHTGKNIIGRRATQSTADFQIPTDGSKRLSREHLVVEVKKVPGKGFVHYASLFKEKTNATLIGNTPLEYGDCLVLHHGDIITLPDVKVKFEIPDDEGTEF